MFFISLLVNVILESVINESFLLIFLPIIWSVAFTRKFGMPFSDLQRYLLFSINHNALVFGVFLLDNISGNITDNEG